MRAQRWREREGRGQQKLSPTRPLRGPYSCPRGVSGAFLKMVFERFGDSLTLNKSKPRRHELTVALASSSGAHARDGSRVVHRRPAGAQPFAAAQDL